MVPAVSKIIASMGPIQDTQSPMVAIRAPWKRPFCSRLAKILENLTLEQNGRSYGAMMETIGPWLSCLGLIEAMILLTAGTISL